MRHIPEDELHAYLDQALSRSQCVEIESHLADCPSCQAARDGIAALRDRTTALLARLAPPRGFPPAFEALQRIGPPRRRSSGRRRLQAAAWAASLVAAVGLGWGASSLLRSGSRPRRRPGLGRDRPAAVRSRSLGSAVMPSTTAALEPTPRPCGDRGAGPARAGGTGRPAPSAPPIRVRGSRLESSAAARQRARPALSVLDPDARAGAHAGSSGPPAARISSSGGMWRTMCWDGAKAEAGDRLPHIDGLPVVQVQVQTASRARDRSWSWPSSSPPAR